MRSFGYVYLFACLLTLSSCDSSKITSSPSLPPAAPLDYDSTSETIQINGGLIKQTVLNNGLKVILISAPTSKMASAAVGVRVGHRDNPKNLQGLAHFLEHMLFLGTKEFPIVGEYSQFLKTHGGYSNAYTSGDHTNYYLEIHSGKFEDALNRLSRFFVNPLFDTSYVEREKNAVHNEYNMRFQAFRKNRPYYAFLNTDDSDRLFAVGNNTTLKDATADDTRKMFEDYYYAEAMHAVIAGPQNLNTLEQWAQKYFSDIKSKKEAILKEYDPVSKMDLSNLPAQVNFKSDGEDRFLNLFIPVKNAKVENEKLLSAFGHLLGDESESSLMIALQNQGWVRPGEHMLNGGATHSGVSLSLQLTEKGFNEYTEVINYVKGYLIFLKTKFPNYINQELKRLEATQALSQEFFEISAETIQGLNRSYFYNDWRPSNWHELFLGRIYPDITSKQYKDYLSRLLFDKILIQIAHPSFPDVSVDFASYKNINQGGISLEDINGQKVIVDSLYNFASSVVNIDPSIFQKEGHFTLKAQNVYLPRNFDIYPNENIKIYTKKSGPWGEIRYNPTPEVQSAKVYMNLNFYSSGIDFKNPKDAASLFLYREWIRNKSASTSYAMKVAGFEMTYPIFVDKGAIAININGWSDTFFSVLEDTLSTLEFSMSEEEFLSLKNSYKDKIQLEQAGDISAMASRSVLSKVTPTYLDYPDLYQTLDNLSSTEFRQFIKSYFSSFHVRGALTGNIQNNYVDRIINLISQHFNPTWNTQQTLITSPLDQLNDQGNSILIENTVEGPDKQNSLYLGYWNLGSNSDLKEKLISKIFGAWIYPDYYEELRTNKQLAYSLYAIYSRFMSHDFLVVQLQSSTHTADQIETEVDGFVLDWVKNTLPTKTEGLLQSTVDNLISTLELPKAPGALHQLVLQFVDDDFETLESVKETRTLLKSITVNDIVSYGTKNFLQTPKRGAFIKVNKKP